jgi:hypothetical protein
MAVARLPLINRLGYVRNGSVIETKAVGAASSQSAVALLVTDAVHAQNGPVVPPWAPDPSWLKPFSWTPSTGNKKESATDLALQAEAGWLEV